MTPASLCQRLAGLCLSLGLILSLAVFSSAGAQDKKDVKKDDKKEIKKEDKKNDDASSTINQK